MPSPSRLLPPPQTSSSTTAGNTDACARYRDLLVDRSTFSSVTVEEFLHANVLPSHTAKAQRKRYIPR